jgi:hypothetical protein
MNHQRHFETPSAMPAPQLTGCYDHRWPLASRTQGLAMMEATAAVLANPGLKLSQLLMAHPHLPPETLDCYVAMWRRGFVAQGAKLPTALGMAGADYLECLDDPGYARWWVQDLRESCAG